MVGLASFYASRVWDPTWRGYDPQGPDDQPLFASLPEEGRKVARNWVHTAWRLNAGLRPRSWIGGPTASTCSTTWIRRRRWRTLRSTRPC